MLILPSAKGIIHPSAAAGGGPSRTDPLSTTDGAIEWDIDVTISDSWNDSDGYFHNLIASPPSGAGQTAWDVNNGSTGGADSADLSFIGSVGDPAAYMEAGGTQYMKLRSGTNPAPLNEIHKSPGGLNFTFCILLGMPGSTGAAASTVVTTRIAGIGITVNINTASATAEIIVSQEGSTATVTVNSETEGVIPAYGDDVMVTITYDHDTSTLGYACNSDTFTTETLTFNATSSDAESAMVLGARADGATGFFVNGLRFYAACMTFDNMSNARLAALRDAYEFRHERTY